VVHKVWKSLAPSKVVVFSWQTLLSRIPTRANLATRGVVLEDAHVLWAACGGDVETENHLFLLCPLAWSIWIEVYRWFGVVEVFPGNICSFFEGLLSSLKYGKKSSKGILMVWHAVIWILWRVRNGNFFFRYSYSLRGCIGKNQVYALKMALGKETEFPLFVL
jgi:hypothetical protein